MGVAIVAVLAMAGAACGEDGAEPVSVPASTSADEEVAQEVADTVVAYGAADGAKETCAMMSDLYKRFLTDEKPERCAKVISNDPNWTTDPVEIEVNEVTVKDNKAMADVFIHEFETEDRIWLFNVNGEWQIQGQGMQPPPEWEILLDLEPLQV